MSRIVRFATYGGPEVLHIEDEPVPPPGSGELRIRIEAIGLNRAEAAFRAGQYLEQADFPSRIGYEAAGIVDEIGPEVAGFAKGEAVCVIPAFSMARYGVYAELANVPADAVLKRPAGLAAEPAAALWMAYLTAYGALVDIGQLGRGDRVLITAPSSSVGLAAIQIANALGAVPIALTRSPTKGPALFAAGARHVLVGEAGAALPEAVRQASEGRGVQLVFDPVAGPGVQHLADTLSPNGMLVIYGNLSGAGDSTPFPFRAAVSRGLCLRGYLVFEIIRDPSRRQKAEHFIREGLARGSLQPTIARQFPFEQIAEAHRYLESNQQFGKVVVTLAPSSHRKKGGQHA